ncbi:MAG: enoyl-CoA hydratase/isomerase family protein, partial [Myxococcales bacterium]|nr:enoyl-CoA hydratase/isomerase family protein [Myxococcales bacterium]
MSDLVLREALADGVVQLTINRADRRNALNSNVLNALRIEFEAVRADNEARVVVLTGAGDKAFCAGGDLSPAAGAGGLLNMHHDRHGFVDLFHSMRRCGKPIIARVQGHCLAGGLGLMLACDLAIASESATFGTPEIKRGLFPMMIMALIFR